MAKLNPIKIRLRVLGAKRARKAAIKAARAFERLADAADKAEEATYRLKAALPIEVEMDREGPEK